MSDYLFELPRDEERLRARLRPRKDLIDRSLIEDVSAIFARVESSGDAAILEATQRFDHVQIQSVVVPEEYVKGCVNGLNEPFKEAVCTAISNIREVNQALMPKPDWRTEIRPGTIIGEKSTSLDGVGLYVPAQKGPLVSTALMLVSAAKVAGVRQVVVAIPPQSDGYANPSTIAAARLAGADLFVTGNGVGLIAGLSLGTESIPEVDGIFGPGPAGIAAAMSVAFSYGKRTVIGLGPTDCAIIADESSGPDLIAGNLMCEGEHGPDSSVLLVTTSRSLAEKVVAELDRRIPTIEKKPRDYLATVFGTNGMGAIVVVPDIETACKAVDEFAPEHLLVLCSKDVAGKVLDGVRNAGEILIGKFTPFSAANYAIGITAVLPTSGFARSFSGITCKDMLKTSTIGELSESALKQLRPIIQQLGIHEGLPCHINAVEIVDSH
jgi:histidinol dehydrogenase